MSGTGSTAYLLLFEVEWGWMGAAATSSGLTATTLPTSRPEEAARALLHNLRRGRSRPADVSLGAMLVSRQQLALAPDGEHPVDLASSAAQRTLRKLAHQAKRYFEGARIALGIPLDLSGLTEFQQQALLAARQVPYGRTASYGDLARRVGRPEAPRAVGNAMARNPLPLVIPCHRIIAADGSLGGFGGNLRLKERLLKLEGVLGTTAKV